MEQIKKIELLAPAKNLDCGLAAIEHGADAVYIGANSFGARLSAGNSIEDIKTLVDRAHLFGVKIYVTLNTILTDSELIEAEKLIWRLWEEAQIDALIIQDFGITKMNLPPIPLHASTQMDNRGVQKVKFLEEIGFGQVVLPRESTLDEIREIAKETTVPLEFFVHGAICVSYSGQCYISQAMAKRSANKGSCAQYCRLPYTLRDANGQIIMESKHLLSMKDLNLSEHLEELLDAGITSLKIEGRMKDVSYVKNTVTYYRNKLDKIFENRKEYKRSSYGKSEIGFVADLSKTFNRSFSTYFLYGRNHDSKSLWTLDSPKSLGEAIGVVESSTKNTVKINSKKTITAGDGICYFENNELKGLNVNHVNNNTINTSANIKKGTLIYRNRDHKFESDISRNNTAKRTLSINFELNEVKGGYRLQAIIPVYNLSVEKLYECNKEIARTNQTSRIIDTLSKTGDTIFHVNLVDVKFNNDYFIPASQLAEWRRELANLLLMKIPSYYNEVLKQRIEFKQTTFPFPDTEISYTGNVMNSKALEFYKQHSCTVTDKAFEAKAKRDVPLMFMRHCIKYSLELCPKMKNNSMKKFKEPYQLIYKDQIFKLEFDCKQCEMKIYQQ